MLNRVNVFDVTYILTFPPNVVTINMQTSNEKQGRIWHLKFQFNYILNIFCQLSILNMNTHEHHKIVPSSLPAEKMDIKMETKN